MSEQHLPEPPAQPHQSQDHEPLSESSLVPDALLPDVPPEAEPAADLDADAVLPASVDSEQLSELNSAESHWMQQIGGAWNGAWSGATDRLLRLLPKDLPQLPSQSPVDPIARKLMQWFNVDEAQIAEILTRVRSELPTTEALLIGKPQSGKSSIVRGLTGVSAEIVGQGFRPHTQTTQRYDYPSSELPLLIFTDTVGLGDVQQQTGAIVRDLTQDLQRDTNRAKILILTVKINDFAIDSLRQIAQQLRQQYPAVPCLLVVTCLHEAYPAAADTGATIDHPAYPPTFEQVQRSFAAMQQAFAGLYDEALLIDFTLEEDGYNPVFYGLEALRDAIAQLLPEAEARTIHQLLDAEAGQQLGDLYRDVGRHYQTAFAVMAAAVEAIPLPFASMPVLTALQISMVGLLGKLYGQTLTPAQAGGVVSTIAGGFLAQAIGRELIKFLPGFGSVIAASWAAAYTWALGETACVYFGDLMGGRKPDPQKIQRVMKTAFQSAQEQFQSVKVIRN